MRAPLERMRIRSQGLSESGALHNLFGDRVRTYPNGKARPHAGWDLEASIGTPVLAIEAGEIVDVRYSQSYGNIIALQFGFQGMIYYAFYYHLSGAMVKVGRFVEEGEWIGATGATGKSADGQEPHLHFEIRYVPFLPPGLGTQGRIDPALIFGRYLVCK